MLSAKLKQSAKKIFITVIFFYFAHHGMGEAKGAKLKKNLAKSC